MNERTAAWSGTANPAVIVILYLTRSCVSNAGVTTLTLDAN